MENKVTLDVGTATLTIEKREFNPRIEINRTGENPIGLNVTRSELMKFLLDSLDLMLGEVK